MVFATEVSNNLSTSYKTGYHFVFSGFTEQTQQLKYLNSHCGRHSVAVVDAVASQQDVPKSKSVGRPGPFCVLPVSGFFGFLPQCKHMHVKLTGDFILAVGVSVSSSFSYQMSADE